MRINILYCFISKSLRTSFCWFLFQFDFLDLRNYLYCWFLFQFDFMDLRNYLCCWLLFHHDFLILRNYFCWWLVFQQRLSELHKIQEGRVKLDIGGHQFTTSLLTLTRESDSMLAAMFSGRHCLKTESDGSYFIDRDGTHFRYILNYLRDGCIKDGTLPCSETILRELLTEAEYYQLSGLVDMLSAILHKSCTSKDEDTLMWKGWKG